jgi:hypothetical protein
MALAMEPPDGDKRAFERDAVATWAGGVAAVDASNPAAAVASTSGGDAAGGEWARKLRNDSWTHKDAIGKTAWSRVDARWRDAAPEPDPDPAATEEARAARAAEGRAANAASTVHALDARTRRALSDALASCELSSLDGKQRGEFRRVLSVTLVPIRPRRRGERRSLRTLLPGGASLRPSIAFNPRPRCLSTPTDAFELHPDVALNGTTLSTALNALRREAVDAARRAERAAVKDDDDDGLRVAHATMAAEAWFQDACDGARRAAAESRASED